MQSGPQQLDRAYFLSKILHEQQQQRDERRKKRLCEEQKCMDDGKKFIAQCQQWIDNQNEQMRQYRERCAEYKHIISTDIADKERQRADAMKKLNEIERLEREANILQLQSQLDREKEARERYRQLVHENAKRSLQMTSATRASNKMT